MSQVRALILAAILAAAPAASAWTKVQASGTSGSTSATLTVALTVSAGNLLVGVGTTNPGADQGTSDGSNGAWTAGNDCTLSGSTRHVRAFWFVNTAGGSITVSYKPNASNNTTATFEVAEYNDPGASTATFDVQPASCGTGTNTAPTVTTPSVAGSGELIIGGVATGIALTITVGGAYTLADVRPAGAGTHRGAEEYNLSGGTGAIVVDWSLSTTAVWGAVAAAFIAGASSTTTPQSMMGFWGMLDISPRQQRHQFSDRGGGVQPRRLDLRRAVEAQEHQQ